MKLLSYCILMIGLLSCKADFTNELRYELMTLNNEYPKKIHREIIDFPQKQQKIKLSYEIDGSVVVVNALEFENAVDSYSYWLSINGKNYSKSMLVGDIVRKQYWAGKWVVQIDMDQYQILSDSLATVFIGKLKGSEELLSNELISLPIKNRVLKGTTISKFNIWGQALNQPILYQRYKDEIGEWTIAKTLEPISKDQFMDFRSELSKRLKVESQEDLTTILSSDMGKIGISFQKKHLYIVWGARSKQSIQGVLEDIQGL